MSTSNEGHFLARKLPESMRSQAGVMTVREVRIIRGSLTNGRRPYVQIDRAPYTSDVLSHAGHLIGKKIIVEINEEDMRQVKAYLENGHPLGPLIAGGRWHRTKHSRTTRKAINRLLYRRILVLTDTDDPVISYCAYKSTMRLHGKKAKKPSISKRDATEATRVSIEAGLELELQYKTTNSIPSNTGKHPREVSSLIGLPPPKQKKILNRR